MDTSSSDFLIYDVHYPNSKPNIGSEVSQDHVWDRPWSTDLIRQNSHCWSLGGDSGLLNKLQEIAHSLTSQIHLVQKEVNSFSHEVEVTNANLNNINNDFLMLSNCQFVESRVYDEEVSSSDISTETEKKDNQNKSKEERENEIISNVSCALKLGISVIDRAYEHLDVQDSDSEGENEPYNHEPILRPKNPYWNRPLPYLIGTQAFYNDSKLGIVDNFSDDELPNDVSVNSSRSSLEEQEKNSELEANGEFKDIDSDTASNQEEFINEALETNQDRDLFSPQESNDNKDISDEDDFLTTTLKTNFDEELSSKLKIPQQENGPTGPARVKAKASHSISSNDSNHNKSTDNLFQDLPVDERFVRKSDSISIKSNEMDDDDDLFGKDGLFSSKKKIDSFQSNSLLKSKKDNEDLNIKSNMKRNVDSRKKNLDGKTSFNDDLFNDDDSDLFATSTIKKAGPSRSLFDEKEIVTPDREQNKPTPVGAKSMFGANVNKLNLQLSQHFKNNEIDDNSDFGSGQVSRSTSSASIRDSKKEISAISASNSTLFDGDDDEDNLFSSSSTNVSKSKSRPIDNLFNQAADDDLEDLFSPIATASKYTSSNSISSARFQADKISITKSETSSNFDDDQDELFFQDTSAKQHNFSFLSDTKASSLTNVSSKNSAQIRNEFAQSEKSALPKSLFDDEDDSFDDLFKTDLKIKTKSESKPLRVKSEPKSLFSDDDVDLFGHSTAAISDINLFGNANADTSKMKDEKKKPISISDVEVNKTTSNVTEDIKVAVKIEENIEADGLFVLSAKVDKTATPTAVIKKTSSGDKISKLRTELENQLGDKFGGVDTGASPSARKKPIGGISILGPGLVPNLLKPRSPSHLQRDVGESISKQNDSSKENLNKSSESIFPSASSGLAKGEAVSFDAPADGNVLLHNANKERAKIQIKRRPQTRKARHETIRNSTIIDSVDSEKLFTSESQISSVSAPTSPTPETNLKPNISTIPIKSVKMEADKTPNLSILSPSTDEDDLFIVDSRQPTIPPLDKNSKTAQINLPTSKHRSSKENLFGESSDEGDSEELFIPKSGKINMADTLTEKASNFSKKDSGTPPSFDFTSKNRSPKAEVKTDEDDLFVNKASTDATKIAQPEPKVKELPFKTVNKTPATSKSKPSKSLFDDDEDDDDLFNTSNSAPKSKSIGATNKSPAKSKSLFDDEDDNDLFEDPLMAKNSKD